MKSPKTYLLQVHVQKCKIQLNESGTVGLLLRAGRSQAQITDPKPIIKGTINFNTNIKLNLDESALDTQRCTLTLNFTSNDQIKKVIGIVVINLPPVNQEIEKPFKITSTPDKEAQIELCVSVNQLEDHLKIVSKQNLTEIKNPEAQFKRQSSFQKLSSFVSQGSRLQTPQRNDDKPASPASSMTEKLNLKSRVSQNIEANLSYEELLIMTKKLQRQKELLKELLKVEMAKTFKAETHLKNIIDVLKISIGVNAAKNHEDFMLRSSLPGESVLMKKQPSHEIHRATYSQVGLNLNNNLGSVLDPVKESRLEDGVPGFESKVKSTYSLNTSRSVDLVGILASLKKNIEQNTVEKSEIRKMFEKIKCAPQIDADPKRIQTLKTKINRSYVELIGKGTLTKDDVLKHKIDLNKLLDEILNGA